MTERIEYNDPKNFIPTMTLHWEGPGWYGSGAQVFFHIDITRLGTDRNQFPEDGYCVNWANTPQEAAGEYRRDEER